MFVLSVVNLTIKNLYNIFKGHNSDGRYFVTSNKLSFRCELVPRRIVAFIEKTREGHVSLVEDVAIVNVACGINHSVRFFAFVFKVYAI